MMKKITLFSLLTSCLLLAACADKAEFTPSMGGTSASSVDVVINEVVPSPEPPEEEDELICTYDFYFDYSHQEEPILSMTAPMLKPLTSCPEAVNSEAKIIALGANLGYEVDPLFPKFIGFSYYSLCLDEDGLWDFTKDYKQQSVISLYAIWVSE